MVIEGKRKTNNLQLRNTPIRISNDTEKAESSNRGGKFHLRRYLKDVRRHEGEREDNGRLQNLHMVTGVQLRSKYIVYAGKFNAVNDTKSMSRSTRQK